MLKTSLSFTKYTESNIRHGDKKNSYSLYSQEYLSPRVASTLHLHLTGNDLAFYSALILAAQYLEVSCKQCLKTSNVLLGNIWSTISIIITEEHITMDRSFSCSCIRSSAIAKVNPPTFSICPISQLSHNLVASVLLAMLTDNWFSNHRITIRKSVSVLQNRLRDSVVSIRCSLLYKVMTRTSLWNDQL